MGLVAVQPLQPKAIATTKPGTQNFRVSHRCLVATISVPVLRSLSEGQADDEGRPFADLGTDINAPVV